jgi:hypothetical protein
VHVSYLKEFLTSASFNFSSLDYTRISNYVNKHFLLREAQREAIKANTNFLSTQPNHPGKAILWFYIEHLTRGRWGFAGAERAVAVRSREGKRSLDSVRAVISPTLQRERRSSMRKQRHPQRWAQNSLGHGSRAVHEAYASGAFAICPPLEEYERKIVPLPKVVNQ